MLQREDHGVGHKHAAGLLGDRGRQDVGVNGEGEVASARVPRPPQRGIFRAEELTQVFVEHEHQLGHPCKTAEHKRRRKRARSRRFIG